jgi:hypothetical protein
LKSARSSSARILAFLCGALLFCAGSWAGTTSKASSSAKSVSTAKIASHTHKVKKAKKTSYRRRGQQKIDKQRTTEIQEALIREHYLDGKPSGMWDQKTQSALQRYQSDNGWQSKTTPDSRALIKLGLGPDHQHLLNPESAMTGPLPIGSTQKTAPSTDATPDASSDVPKIPNNMRK